MLPKHNLHKLRKLNSQFTLQHRSRKISLQVVNK